MGRRGRRAGPYGDGALDEDEDGHLTARRTVLDERLTLLEGHVLVKAAARIGETFGVDPVVVLDERDTLRKLVRIAAHNVVVRDHEKASRKSRPTT